MLIYLLRHGLAAERGLSDAARELSREGIIQTGSMIEKFNLYGPHVDKAFMSPLQRARQTATMLRKIFPALPITVERKLEPDANVYELFEWLEQFNEQHVLLVGHNPLLSRLLSLILDGTLESNRTIDCSQLYCIEMDVVAPGCGVIKYQLGP